MTRDRLRMWSGPAAEKEGTPPDGMIVERVRAGDAVAFELIMRRYNRLLYRLARGILRNESDAEEVVQETYLRAYAKLAEFKGPQGFRAWLCRIVVNEALGRKRRSGRIISLQDHAAGTSGPHGSDPVETMRTQQPDPERQASSSELRKMLEDAVDSLSDDFRAVFVLRAVEGLSVAETAEALGLRPETVKTRFHRARASLQRHLTGRIGSNLPSLFEFGGARCDRIVSTVLGRLDL